MPNFRGSGWTSAEWAGESLSPTDPSAVFGEVVEGENFKNADNDDVISRYFVATQAGTVDLIKLDGSTAEDYPIHVGTNLVVCRQVAALNGMTGLWWHS